MDHQQPHTSTVSSASFLSTTSSRAAAASAYQQQQQQQQLLNPKIEEVIRLLEKLRACFYAARGVRSDAPGKKPIDVSGEVGWVGLRFGGLIDRWGLASTPP
jgi:hypothetical protein